MTDYNGPERRNEKPGRRGRDFETCMFHEGQCTDIKAVKDSLKTMTPSWVVVMLVGVWISVTGVFGFLVREELRGIRNEVTEVSEKMQIISDDIIRLKVKVGEL